MAKARTLSVEDRAAVDLLLDAGAGGRGRRGVVKVVPGVSQPRLAAAAKLLALLDRMPGVDVPDDLAARTVRAAEADVTGVALATAPVVVAGVQLH